MAVRFKEDCIFTTKGEVLEVSYEDLRQACLKDEYSTISIKEIIFQAVYEILGTQVMGNNHRKSELFNRLEKEIQQHPPYQEAKKQQIVRDNKVRQTRKAMEGDREKPFADNRVLVARERKILQRYYRGSYNKK